MRGGVNTRGREGIPRRLLFHAARTIRWVMTCLLWLLVLWLSACTPSLNGSQGPSPTPTGPEAESPLPLPVRVNLAGEPDARDRCPRQGPLPRAATELTPSSGEPGTLVTLSGETGRDEGARWIPVSRIEVWWDERSPDAGGAVDGNLRLASFRPGSACTFAVTLPAPEAPPGVHSLVLRLHDRSGYGIDPPISFRTEPVGRP